MIVEIDGQQYDVPDNATPEHIQKSLGLSASQENANLESTGWSGVATDAVGKMLQAAYAIPSAIVNAPSEIYGAGEQLLTNPKRAAQNIGAGLGEHGHNILSGFGNLRDYLVKKQIVSPESHSWRLPESILPREFNYGEALGRKGEQAGDALLSAVPGIAGTLPFTKAVGGALKELPLTKKMAARPFVQAKKLAEEKGVDKVNIPKHLIKEAKDFFPDNNKSYKELFKSARLGDYDALHTLQSDLASRSRELKRFFSTGADRIRGKEANDLRQNILKAMREDLTKQGHLDIADLRKKGANRYRQHMTYVRPAGKLLAGYAATHVPGFSLAEKLRNTFNL